jgi:hypothetical protein
VRPASGESPAFKIDSICWRTTKSSSAATSAVGGCPSAMPAITSRLSHSGCWSAGGAKSAGEYVATLRTASWRSAMS